jgi:hypothetical protein
MQTQLVAAASASTRTRFFSRSSFQGSFCHPKIAIMLRQLSSRFIPAIAVARSAFLHPGTCSAAAVAATRAIRSNRPAAAVETPDFFALYLRTYSSSAPTACRALSRSIILLRRCAHRNFSSSPSSSRGPTEGSGIIFLPALTIPRFLRAFAVTQAAFCLVSGAALSLLHNPLTGGTLKSVCRSFRSLSRARNCTKYRHRPPLCPQRCFARCGCCPLRRLISAGHSRLRYVPHQPHSDHRRRLFAR